MKRPCTDPCLRLTCLLLLLIWHKDDESVNASVFAEHWRHTYIIKKNLEPAKYEIGWFKQKVLKQLRKSYIRTYLTHELTWLTKMISSVSLRIGVYLLEPATRKIK